MKFDSSTLFVNTGRKPLPSMQKRKKNNRNTIALIICIAIIAVLCVFVGSIARIWFSYNEETKPAETKVTEETPKKTEVKPKPEKEEPRPEVKPKEEKKKSNPSFGEESELSRAADKAFSDFEGVYSYGYLDLSNEYTYINNTDKIYNSAALGAFLMEYASDAIYLGKFDYSTDVMGNAGRDLMTSAFSRGSVEAANLLIQHFGVDKLNTYFAKEGYTDTVFAGTIGNEESYTTSQDLIKLMKKMYSKTTFFPYSDMYSKMRVNIVDNKISAGLPSGASCVNISFENGEEIFDAAIIYLPEGKSIIFVTMAEGDVSEAIAAINAATSAVCTPGEQE